MSKVVTKYSEIKLSAMKRMAAPLLCVLVLFYLGFHMISGERGVFALFKETHRLEALKEELKQVKSKRIALEKKTILLSDKSLDLDLLDEQARLVLGLAGRNELVVFLDDTVN